LRLTVGILSSSSIASPKTFYDSLVSTRQFFSVVILDYRRGRSAAVCVPPRDINFSRFGLGLDSINATSGFYRSSWTIHRDVAADNIASADSMRASAFQSVFDRETITVNCPFTFCFSQCGATGKTVVN